MKFICISDTHVGGKFNEEMFIKGAEYLNQHQADYYLMSGDLTDQGTLEEYQLVTEKYLKMIDRELLMVPGNHDVKNVGDLLWEEFIGPRFFVKEDPENKVKILGLDSNEPDRNTGRMGRKAIDRIYQEFKDLDDGWTKVLVFHHQSLPIKYTGRERSAIVDAGSTIKAIMDTDIDLVVNGHRHISNVYRLTDGIHQTLIVNIGTLSCRKTRYHEQYSVTEIDFDSKTRNAEVRVKRLNQDFDETIKYQGNLKDLPNPGDEKEKLVTMVQIASTDFSDDIFDLEKYSQGLELINWIENCDVVVHNGNITARSRKSEFELGKALLNHIKHPLVVLPGPHDFHAIGQEYYQDYFGNTQTTYETEHIHLLGFNSCILDEKIGRLGRSRSQQVVQTFEQNSRVGIVAFHHTIIPLPRTKHESELQDAGDVLSLLVEDDSVNLVLTGAKRRAGAWQVNDTVFVNAGTISSKNLVTKEGNSANLISIYRTSQGLWYEVDEIFTDNGNRKNLGRFHVKSSVSK